MILSGQPPLGGLVLDGPDLYSGATGAILKVAVDGSEASEYPAGGQPLFLAADQDHIYFTTAEGGVMAMAKP